MLEQANEPIGKTALMYRMSFSVASMKYYIAFAESCGFIRYDNACRKFRTTVKGRKYLEAYNKLIDLVES